MPHIAHLQGNQLPRGPQRECVLCEIQASTQALQGPFAQEGRDIRIQDKCGERALNAGHTHSDVSCMTNFTYATAPKFKHRMRWIAGHLWKAPAS